MDLYKSIRGARLRCVDRDARMAQVSTVASLAASASQGTDDRYKRDSMDEYFAQVSTYCEKIKKVTLAMRILSDDSSGEDLVESCYAIRADKACMPIAEFACDGSRNVCTCDERKETTNGVEKTIDTLGCGEKTANFGSHATFNQRGSMDGRETAVNIDKATANALSIKQTPSAKI